MELQEYIFEIEQLILEKISARVRPINYYDQNNCIVKIVDTEMARYKKSSVENANKYKKYHLLSKKTLRKFIHKLIDKEMDEINSSALLLLGEKYYQKPKE